jgi:DNA-directed RNA polymerase subunit M/transcription elongation factor TFIIS
MGTISKKQVCKCENCGNEAEMVVTCSLPDEEGAEDKVAAVHATEKHPEAKRVRGKGTCSHCGNEADMWIDL